MAGGVAFALVLLLALVAPLVLYDLVRAEHNKREGRGRSERGERDPGTERGA